MVHLATSLSGYIKKMDRKIQDSKEEENGRKILPYCVSYRILLCYGKPRWGIEPRERVEEAEYPGA